MQERKYALVTGGVRGIGKSLVECLVQKNYFVYINGRSDSASLSIWIETLNRNGMNAQKMLFDVSDENSIKASLATTNIEHLDLLINNAGMNVDNLISQIKIHDFNKIMDTNYWGAVNTYHMFLSFLKKSKAPTVINIGSIAAHKPKIGQSAYAMSKAMLVEWTKNQALVDPDTKFFIISPGPVSTELIEATVWNHNPDYIAKIPAGRIGTTEDISQFVLFVITNRDKVMSGYEFILDGGLTLSM